MRFETDVLTYRECESGCCKSYDGSKSRDFNFACRDEIVNAGWEMPQIIGSRIVLVFSTTYVADVSQCQVNDLIYAGSRALDAIDPALRPAQYTVLSWWPEIVTGGE